ncbi:MAG: hypothetical protein JJU29_22865 [Verrucomicrobia bacterium]|nr:hypothetical protein [Verrucomicrobiota bacterium]MCH8514357.1 hypothetical protein [Kiritimatiellia bacterium]
MRRPHSCCRRHSTVRDTQFDVFEKSGSFPEALRPLREWVPPEEADRVSLFGEYLPEGLTLGSG